MFKHIFKLAMMTMMTMMTMTVMMTMMTVMTMMMRVFMKEFPEKNPLKKSKNPKISLAKVGQTKFGHKISKTSPPW